jgi:hypothetical protein
MSDTANFGPKRALEIIRRLCLLAGALATAWCLVIPTGALFRVRDVDLARLQKQDDRRMRSDLKMMSRVSGAAIDPNDPTINTASTMSPAQYVAKKTKDCSIEVSGSQWTAFYQSVQQTLAGKAQTFARNVSVGRGPYLLYFPTDAVPIKELAGRLGDSKGFTYLAVRDGSEVKYLEVLFQRPQNAQHDAPNWLFYPLRRQAGWWFIIGLLAYTAIPWYRKKPDELRYSTGRAMVGPDMLGMVLSVFFLTLPILIITGNAGASGPLDLLGFRSGWWPVTLVMGLMALSGLASVIVALWYGTFSLVLTPDSLLRRTLFSTEDYPFADIEAVEPARWAWPAWLRLVVILIGLFNWRLLGPVLIGSSEEAYGAAIRFKDGRTLKLWMSHLPGFDRIFQALRKAGVPLDPELAKIIDKDFASPKPETKPGGGGKIGAAILLLLTVAGTLTWQFWPEKTRPVKRELTYSYEALAQRRQVLNEMKQISNQMKQKAGTVEFDDLMKQHDELQKRYDAIQQTEEE